MSRLVELRTVYFEVGTAALMIFVLILGHGYLTGSGITVHYDLRSNVSGETQLYWSAGRPLSEDKQSARKIRADVVNAVKVDIDEKSPVKLVRIDPFKSAGIFRINNIRVDLMATLIPLGSWGHWTLEVENAAAINQLEKHDAEEWEATGNDPYFLFQIPQVSKYRIFLLNFLSGLVVVTSVVLLTRLTSVVTNSGKGPYAITTLPMTAIGIYGVFFVMALLSSQFADMRAYSRWVVYAVLTVWIMSYVLVRRGFVSRPFVHAIAGLVAIVIVTLPDFLFHLGKVTSPAFSRFGSPLYHWRLGKPSNENYVNSSLRYYKDFRAIKRLIVPGSYFLSDVATSYYASAALPLYAVNVLPHHRYGVVPISQEDIRNFCDVNMEKNLNRIEGYLQKRAELHKKNGLAPMRYLFLNTDDKNRNVASRCLNRRREMIRVKLDSILTPVHNGEFIHVFEFRVY